MSINQKRNFLSNIKKITKFHILIIAIFTLLAFLALLFYVIFASFEWIAVESRDYRLMRVLHETAKSLRDFKSQYGSYPEKLTLAIKSDQVCTNTFFVEKCTTILYKPSTDLQDFRLAVDSKTFSGGWVVAYYDPRFSMIAEQERLLSTEQKDLIRSKYGEICEICFAYRPDEKSKYPDPRPVYKEDSKRFPNPDEWPDLP